jgi:hypothetical protein
MFSNHGIGTVSFPGTQMGAEKQLSQLNQFHFPGELYELSDPQKQNDQFSPIA